MENDTLYNLSISVPTILVYYTGISSAICHHRATLIKATSHAYCEEGLFCALLLEGRVTSHTQVEDLNQLSMCRVFANSKQNCKLVLLNVSSSRSSPIVNKC